MTGRGCYLTTTELHRVGERPDFRDVDVRLILNDDDFDRLFGHAPELWSVFSYAVSRMLSDDTGLAIDFQVQRMTEANAQYGDRPRNPLGGRARRAMFAGRGDATLFADRIEVP